MTIFALFLCAMGTCELVPIMPNGTFATLAACQQHIGRKLGASDRNGHFPMANGMYYECRSKHVETWEPTH
jgi:hypothetical protein